MIRVPNLPSSGFAASNDRVTWLVDLEGHVIDRLQGFVVAGNPGNQGVWLQRGRDYYRIGVRGLELVDRHLARDLIHEETAPDLDPPPGSRYRGTVAGRWRYGLKGPNGVLLAQWSGECESPNAFWIEPGEDPVLVTGGDKVAAGPESIALGWGTDGAAYAYLGLGLCGTSGDPPGIYAFDAPGEGTLIYRSPRHARVDMWGR